MGRFRFGGSIIVVLWGLFTSVVWGQAAEPYSGAAFQVADVSEVSFEDAPAIAVAFSVPVNSDHSFEDYLSIAHKQGTKIEGGWVLSERATTAYFTHIEAQTDYTVTVYRGLQATNGKVLDKTINKTLKTRRIANSVSFASTGSILPSKSYEGLPIYTVNVAEVDIDFHRVKEDQVSQFLYSWINRQAQGSWNLKRYQTYIDLAHSGRYTLNPPLNKRHRINIPVKDIAALQTPGIYMAVMKPAGKYPQQYQVTYFVVSDIGVHARFYQDRFDVYANSLASAQPMAGVTLSLLNKTNKVLAQTKTTPDGLGIFYNPDSQARYLLAEQGRHVALLKLMTPALDLSEFELNKRRHQSTEAFIYGPRDLYRPGETIIFNALLRDGDGKFIGNTPLKAILRSADNREVQTRIIHGNRLAHYEYEYLLPTNAKTGEWRLQLMVGKAQLGEYVFKVEEFLPERMALDLGGDKLTNEILNSTEAPLINVEGAYLYGAPAAQNRLGGLLSVSQQRHPIESMKGYEFGDADEYAKAKRTELPDIKLNAQGQAEIKLLNTWENAKSPLDIHYVATLYESGGRPVVRDRHFTTWPSKKLIGIRPIFEKDELGYNTQAGFEIVVVDQTGQRYGASGLELSLIRERRDYFWVFDSSRGWQRNHTERKYPIFTSNLDVSATERNVVEVPVEWGGYLIELRDPNTGTKSSLRFRAGWWYGNGESENNARPDVVDIKLDKKRYRAGDIAKVALHTPYAGEGFLLVEADAPLHWQHFKVKKGETTIEIPVDETWNQHNIYLSAMVIRPANDVDDKMPNRAIGLLHLPLDREARNIKLEVTTPSTKAAAESELPVSIRAIGADNSQPVMVTLAAVDVGVLNITDFETPNAHQWFFEPRRYDVDARDIYGDVINSRGAALARQRFGGDANLSRTKGGKQAQADVQIVSIFKRAVELDNNGEAEIMVQLPDFNGRLRLMVLGFGETEYGNAETEVTVASPIIAEISMPRFLANGDRSVLTLDLHNLSGQAQQLSVNVSATEPLQLSSDQQQLSLADKEKQVLQFELAALNTFGKGNISVQVKNNTDTGQAPITINRQWSLSVRPAYPAESRMQRKILNEGDALTVSDQLDGLLLTTVEADLKVDSKPPIQLNSHLKHLLKYPYGCLEQSTSSTYPWIFTKPETLDRLGLTNTIFNSGVTLDQRLEHLEKGLAKIQNMQLHNGGFGLWSNESSEQHWLTAYVADFLTDVRAEGVAVDQTLFNKVMTRLHYYVNANSGLFDERWSQDTAHYRFAYRSYAAYVLAKLNRAPLGSLRNLYDQHWQDAKTGLPLVHLGIALIKQGDRQRGMKAIEQGIALPLNSNRYVYYGDYGSSVRDTALMIYMLEIHNIKIAGKSELLFSLSDALASRTYLSTQERLSLFKSGVALANSSGNSWAGELLLDQVKQSIQQVGAYQRYFTGEVLSEGLAFTSKQTKRLFAELTISGYPVVAPEPDSKDIWIERNYFDLNGERIATTSEEGYRQLPTLETGDLVVVHLRVNARERVPDALVIDLLPAGLELENQNLKHAVKLDNIMVDGRSVAELQQQSKPVYQEYRDDRFVAAVNVSNHRAVDLFYLARAVTPGDYVVPPAYVEDMYRPFISGVSHGIANLKIVKKTVEEE